MKNKIELKKYIISTLIVFICLFVLFLFLNIYEYKTYTKNFNNKISAIINVIKKDYPKITDKEIIKILNNDTLKTNDFFNKYGIDVNNKSILIKNDRDYHKFLAINLSFLTITVVILLIIYIRYNYKKEKDIKDIIKCIEQINKKNYEIQIDSISEDELSILKNEIYKTTIMLKEAAENSSKDKLNLKKSLEDISHQLKTPLTSILVMLDNIIEESIKNVSTLCDLRNINIKLNIKENSKIICDDKWQIEALTNIIKNAIEHSKNNSNIIINIENNNVYSMIEVIDFGEGIAKKDIKHIFERFYKCKNTKTDSIGIGLALAKTIIEEDKGTISVESNKLETKFIVKYYKI